MTPERTRIQLCGRLVVELDGARRERELPGRQGRLLFGFLALNRLRPLQRHELASALWQDLPPHADGALRALLSKLRRVVGEERLQGGDGTVVLRLPPTARIDVEAAAEALHRAESAAELGDWRRAWGPAQVALFTASRELLPGLEAPWLDERRLALAELRLRALEVYGGACLAIGGTELRAAERAGRALVGSEPFRESGHRLLMRALARGGNDAEALVAYESLRQTLREELGVAPSAETQALHRDLLRNES